MNSSQFATSRSEVDCLTPTPITCLAFSRSFDFQVYLWAAALMMTKVFTWALV